MGVRYELEVVTKGGTWAGSDADVKFVLKGTKGTNEKEFDGGGGTGRFESANIDKIYMHAMAIGSLVSVTVSLDGSGDSPDWHLLLVRVKGGGIDAVLKFDREIKAGQPVTVNV